MPAEEMVRLHAVVEGRVQGVGFRYYVVDCAEALAVTGWVRNRWEGSVEVLAEGPQPALLRLLGQLRRGPSSSFVSDVNASWSPATGEFIEFRVRSTA